LEGQALAGAKKNARRDGRTIVFVDESGLSERPTRVTTWAPKGQTPVLQYSFNWQQLSLMAGVSFWRLYFRFFHGAIKGPQIVEFLKALKDTIGGKLLMIWDGLPAHRSRLVRDYVESLNGQIQLERLPAYAPEINPAEYVFGYAKLGISAERDRPFRHRDRSFRERDRGFRRNVTGEFRCQVGT
jgi:transposase